MKHTIIIVDDHTIVRQTWSFILSTNPDFEVVRECATGEEAIEQAKKLRPDIILMDINLPGINGIEATEQILRDCPGSRVLGVSLHSKPSFASKMLQKGAMGYITKNSSREEMFDAIRTLGRGERYICKELKEALSARALEEDGDA